MFKTMNLAEVNEFFCIKWGPLSDLILSGVPYVAKYLRKCFSTALKLVGLQSMLLAILDINLQIPMRSKIHKMGL